MKLFESRKYNYDDDDRVGKPVLYSEEFLSEIARKYPQITLQSVHDGEEIGLIDNVHFSDGWLCGDVPSDVNLDGKGLSPLFKPYLLDKGDYFEAVGGELDHIALADNPRNHLLYNEVEKGDNKMSDELKEVLANRVKELERELAVKDNQLESNKKKLEQYNELEKEVKSLRKSNSEYEAQIESSKDKANKWDEYVTNKKTSLVDEIAGDDSSMKETIKDWSLDQLNFLKEHKNVSTEPRGIGNGNAEGLNEVSETDESDDKPSKDKFLELYENKFGEKPTFIQED